MKFDNLLKNSLFKNCDLSSIEKNFRFRENNFKNL